jgi:hypothetical protein
MQKEDAIDRARCEAKRPRFAFWQDHELVQRTWEDDDYDEQEATGLKYGVGFVYYDSLNNSYKKSIQHRDAASSAILREAGLPPLEEHDILSIGSAVSSESSSGAKDGDYRPRQEAAAAGSAVDNSDDDDDDDDDAGFKRKPTKKQQAARNKRRKAATQKEAAAAAAAAAPVSKSGSGSSSHNSKAKAAPSAKPTASKKHAAAAARADDADDGDGKEDAEEGEAADDDEVSYHVSHLVVKVLPRLTSLWRRRMRATTMTTMTALLKPPLPSRSASPSNTSWCWTLSSCTLRSRP